MQQPPYILEGSGAFLDQRGDLLNYRVRGEDSQWDESSDVKLSWALLEDEGKSRAPTTLTARPLERGLSFQGHEGNVHIRLDVSGEQNGVSWKLAVDNDIAPSESAKQVNAVAFTLRGSFLETAASELHLTLPYCAGWTLPIAALQHGERFVLQYPVKLSMQWVSVFEKSGAGVYFGVHDPLPLYKELEVGLDGEGYYVCWRYEGLALKPGKQIALPKVVVSRHEDGWFGGARIYRRWAREFITVPDVPSWYAARPAWAWIGMREQHAPEVLNELDDLPQLSALVHEAGIELVQLTAYNEDGHDTCYPDYWPGESFGGANSLRRAVDQIHAAGRRISIYVNGRIVDPASSLTPEQRASWAVRPEMGGEIARESYGAITFDIMCPGAAEWRELFITRLERLVRTFDLDGVYIDQVSAARAFPCHADNHDHARPAEAWACYRRFVADIRARLRAIKPDLFLATEGVSDIFGQYFDSQQAHQDWTPQPRNRVQPLPDLFRCTFPGHLLNSGAIVNTETGRNWLQLAHLSGSGHDYAVENWRTVDGEFMKNILSVLGWYSRHHHEIRYGVLLPVKTHQQGVQANAFLSGRRLVICGITEIDKAVEDELIELQVDVGNSHVKNVYLQDPNPRACQWRNEGGRLMIRVPQTEFLAIEVELEEPPVNGRDG